MRRRRRREGQVHGAWLAFLASVLALGVLIGLLVWNAKKPDTSATTQPLIVYCAAGIKTPVEAIAHEYEQQYGVPVQLQYGGSQTLLANIELAERGDLYLPGDDSYLHMARKKDLLAEILPLARMTPVLAVRKNNPKHLHTLQDILHSDTRLSQANPDAAAVGKLTRDALQKSGQWDAWQKHVVVSKTTVNDVANDIALGAVDAGIVWDAVVRQMPALETVSLPELSSATAHVAVGVLKKSPQPAAALRFARYLAARDRGLLSFRKAGFTPVEGDRWAETPELRLFAGAMLRPAIEETIAAFREREGVEVTCIYNGCGILVAQMTTNHQSPDAYFACDQSFMTQVKDLFLDPATISSNQLVIFVHKGNPHHIESLDDLGKAGLKIGVGHEKQCAMGALTQETLKQGRAHNRVMKNVKVQSPTGDMLINQLLTGSLDAVIAYISNGANAADKLEAIPIDIPCAIAVQPIAIGKDSEYKQLTQRLVDAIRSRQSRERFESYGFHWRAEVVMTRTELQRDRPTRSDAPFFVALSILGGTYLLLIVAMLAADASFTTPADVWRALANKNIRYAIQLSLLSCSITTILSLWVAIPLGYLLSRWQFPGKLLIDALLDIPIVLPPLVVGLSLLILFQTPPGKAIERIVPVTYAIPSVILAQFAVACAFAVRTMRVSFDQIPPRREQVALTLGCSRSQAFWWVVLPEARRGIVTAATLAWARALGEFGPILVFSGATRMRTEVLPTTVFLELSVGNLQAAVAVSLLMVVAALVVLVIVRVYGMERQSIGP